MSISPMQYLSATSARRGLSSVIEMAQREPITIQKQGRSVAVVLSIQDYQRLTDDNVRDFMLFSQHIGERSQQLGLGEQELDELLKDD